ncbi:flippase [Pseudomonadota bacterium]
MITEKYPVLRKITVNITWLFVDKILRLSVSLLVAVWLARHLGPEQFGLLNFSLALVSLFGAIAALGLSGIVVRDLVNQPDQARQTLGSAFILKLIAALFAYCILIITIFALRPDDSLSKVIVCLLGLTLLFKSTEVVKFWFESQVRSKYVVWVENGIFIFVSLLKAIMLWNKAALIEFVYVMLLESIIIAFALLYTYAKVELNPIHWKVTKERVVSLLKDGWPLIIASAAWIIYCRIDQIMIGQMLDDQAVGYYSVAIKLSEVLNFLPVIIAFSVIPIITELRKIDLELYRQRFQYIYDLTVGIMLCAAVFTSILSGWIIQTLFGTAYENSASVLTIYVWSSVFYAMAIVSGRYLINEGLQKVTMRRHLMGVVLNIPLNLFMIPAFGIKGAAVASLVSLAISNYIYDAINPITRICFKQKTKSIFMISLIEYAFGKVKK